MTLDQLYSNMLRFRSNPASEAMIASLSLHHFAAIQFGEYVDFVCRFCMYGTYDMLLFVFELFDTLKAKLCSYDDFRVFCYTMQDGGKTAPLEQGLKTIKVGHDGRFTFEELVKMNRAFPYIMYPIFSIRVTLMRISLGEFWWERTMYRLSDEAKLKQNLDKGDKLFLAGQKKREEEARVQERMGFFRYNFMPWGRKTARLQMARLAIMASQFEKDQVQLKSQPAIKYEIPDEQAVTPRVKEKSQYEVER